MKDPAIPPHPRHREKLLDLSTATPVDTNNPLLNLAEMGEPLPEPPAEKDAARPPASKTERESGNE